MLTFNWKTMQECGYYEKNGWCLELQLFTVFIEKQKNTYWTRMPWEGVVMFYSETSAKAYVEEQFAELFNQLQLLASGE